MQQEFYEDIPGHGKPNSAARAAFRADHDMQKRFFTALALANHGYLSSSIRCITNDHQIKNLVGYAHNQGWNHAKTYLEPGFDRKMV